MKCKKKLLAAALAVVVCSASPVFAAQGFYSIEDAAWQESRLVYPYHDGSMYQVYTQLGHVTDIELHVGESIQNVMAGETSSWGIETAKVGGTAHVYIKPKAAGISTNFVINTDRRSYRLMVASTEEYEPVVCWTYPADQQRKKARERELTNRSDGMYPELFMKRYQGRMIPKAMNSSYRLEGSRRASKELFPLQIFDDGTRTYIEMPQNNKYDLPVLYNVDDAEKKGKLTLVNYRMHGAYFIADRVFAHARLYYSHKVYVDIYPEDEQGGENK